MYNTKSNIKTLALKSLSVPERVTLARIALYGLISLVIAVMTAVGASTSLLPVAGALAGLAMCAAFLVLATRSVLRLVAIERDEAYSLFYEVR